MTTVVNFAEEFRDPAHAKSEIEQLRRIVRTMRVTAAEAGVTIVTGDTKVVERRAADGLFTTAGGVEIERGMKLMGCTTVSQLSRANLRFRP